MSSGLCEETIKYFTRGAGGPRFTVMALKLLSLRISLL